MSGLKSIIEATFKNAGTGIRVNRVAAADVPGPTTIFAITGGLVLVTGLIGVVTAIRSAGAGSTQALTFSVGATPLHFPALAITGNAAVGTVFTITGDPTDALVVAVGTGTNIFVPLQGGMKGSGGGALQMFGMIMGVGNIQVTHSAGATTGFTRWICTYIPLDDAAAVN